MGYRGVPGLLAAFLCLLYLEAGAAQGDDEIPFGTDMRCREAPGWNTTNDVGPMLESRGVVTVVALLKAS